MFFMFNYVVNMLIPFYELCGHSTDTSSGSCSPFSVAPHRGLVLWLQLAPIQEGLSLRLWQRVKNPLLPHLLHCRKAPRTGC